MTKKRPAAAGKKLPAAKKPSKAWKDDDVENDAQDDAEGEEEEEEQQDADDQAEIVDVDDELGDTRAMTRSQRCSPTRCRVLCIMVQKNRTHDSTMFGSKHTHGMDTTVLGILLEDVEHMCWGHVWEICGKCCNTMHVP